MKGGPPSPQLSGDITPQFQLDDANYLENRFVASWFSFAGIVGVAAGGAGNRSAVQIFNPSGSGIVAVIEKLSIQTTAIDQPQVTRQAPGPSNLTAGVAQGARDSRISKTSTVLLKSSVNAGAINGFGMWAGATLGATSIDVILTENEELVLMPGDFYTVWVNTLNQGENVSFFWRERALEEGELLTGL